MQLCLARRSSLVAREIAGTVASTAVRASLYRASVRWEALEELSLDVKEKLLGPSASQRAALHSCLRPSTLHTPNLPGSR
jgi:hypothetical protein